jgi:hypothetical protein
VRFRRSWLIVLLISAGFPLSAAAQENNKFALGGAYIFRGADGPTSHAPSDLGLIWRFGHDKEGWGWHWGLNWYSLDIDRSIGGGSMEFGELHVRPVMAGYGYTHLMGKAAVTVSVLGGYAFNSFDVSGRASDAFRDRLGIQTVDVHLSNTPVLKPEAKVWYDVNKKVGIIADWGYVVARPRISINGLEDGGRYHADAMTLRVGVVYKLLEATRSKSAARR